MSKVFEVLGSVVKEFLMWIGFFVVALAVLIWWKLSGDGDVKAAPVKPVAAVAVPVVAAPLVTAPDVVAGAVAVSRGDVVAGVGGDEVAIACACYSGVQCTGKRGGKYCIDESGNKRYK